ncbi:alpha/beta hydrolase [Phytomonospora endophytica]|uniref:Acetyl esterase/lipase n=1 Tax=Phytomonospora endophytica TaxID=714109 RepID=A0A841FL07_9ACTN|nr:alpha/beta hydrolase [Phytomonospora endophytica]MBB6036846.1 acetyl esterase/lipase [Phytomonospora endophytica]GIG68120.1 esterase [Phytomonospora endophytica]
MELPIGYLVGVAIVAWCAFFAVIAPRRPRPLAGMTFWFGMVVNEVPFHAAYLLIASTALAAAEGDLGSAGGKASAAVAALVLGALAVVAWRGVRSDRAVARALSEGLGTGWRDEVTVPLRRHRPWLHILLLPARMRRRDVERIANIRYGDAGRRNLLDVYRRRDAPSGAPVLVYFHGGQYRGGAKNREARPLLYRLASQGWVCVSANYRLSPQTTFPGHQIDAKKVIAWVREHGGEYGADPSRLFVAGSSAGSNMAGLCALTPNDPRFQPGFESVDTSVTGAVCLYGYYGHYFGEAPDTAPPPMQPQGYVRPDAPAFFIAHGTYDPLGTVEGARDFTARLRGVSSGPVVYAELPGGQHAFDVFHSARFEAVVDGVEAFTAWVLAESRTTADTVSGGSA